jgi:hypothetical protein
MHVDDVRREREPGGKQPMVTRRQALVGGAALVASAGLGIAVGSGRSAFGGTDPANAPTAWGRIANAVHRNERVYSGLLFGGPPRPSTLDHLYTRHPIDKDRLDWSDESDILFAVTQVVKAGLNTVKLSYWGHEGRPGETDDSATALLFSRNRWPGEPGPPTYTEAEQVAKAWQLFHAAERRGLLVTPMLEVSASNQFWAYFPNDLDELVRRAAWLLRNFGSSPSFLRMYDQHGRSRHVISLLETIHVGPVDPAAFAAGFDRAASILEDQLGYPVGWTADPTPLPAYGSHGGPDPTAMRQASSMLAINPFNITSQGPFAEDPRRAVTEAERLQYARNILTTWVASGIPLVAATIAGYDASKVFPANGVYGFNDKWRRRELELALEFGNAGLSVDYWNGYSEGSAIPPTIEDGDVHVRWLREVIAAHRGRWS